MNINLDDYTLKTESIINTAVTDTFSNINNITTSNTDRINIIDDRLMRLNTYNYNFRLIYEPIIIRFLLSKPCLFINRICKIYDVCITEIHNIPDISYAILIYPHAPHTGTREGKKSFKKQLKDLKNNKNITYEDLVNMTIKYNGQLFGGISND